MSAGACPLPGELVAYARGLPGMRGRADGAGPQAEGTRDEERAGIEAHLAGCAGCRQTLAALALLESPESAEEAALLDRLELPRGAAAGVLRSVAGRVERTPREAAAAGSPAGRLPVGPSEKSPAGPSGSVVRNRARPRWARVAAIAGAAAAVAAALPIVLRGESAQAALASVQDGARPLEAAFSDLPYAPYLPTRGESGAEARFDRPLRLLLEAQEKSRPGAARMLATLYALRRGAGDVQRAERLLAQAGSDPDSDNDRAVLLFGQGDLLAALEWVARALEANPRHRPARFNQALLLARLGLDARAAASFEELAHDDPGSPWSAEARERAGRLRAATHPPSPAPADERRAALIALLGADTPESLARARAQIAALPEGLAQDLVRLGEVARRFSSAQLAQHGKLFARYQALRDAELEGKASLEAARELVRDTADDPLVLVPALQLAAFRAVWMGELREQEELELRALHVCHAVGCDAISEAISADELAEAAGRDGDFAAAHRLQDRAEALFVASAAELQLGELQQKRARLLGEEGRFDEATQASILALRTLAPLASAPALVARAAAANVAAGVASDRKLLRAELELHRGGLSLLEGTQAADASAELASQVALDEAALGRVAEAGPLLRAELERQLEAGHKGAAARVRRTIAELALRTGDAPAALDQTTQALAELAPAGRESGWSEELQQVHLQRAQSLLAVRGERAIPEARAELTAALESALHEVQGSNDSGAQLALARRGAAAGVELAALGVRAGLAAAELLRPLDNLREALFRREPGAAPLPADWSQALPRDSCLLALLPAANSLVRLAIAPGAARALELPVPRSQLEQLIAAARSSRAAGMVPDPRSPTPAEQALAAALYGGLDGPCASATELWLWVEAPLAALALSALPLPPLLEDHAAIGFVTSLDRLLTAEPRWPPAETLFISGAELRGEDGDAVVTLPAAAAERQSLRSALGGNLLELRGPQLTPTALLARLATTRLLHAAVHGAAGSPDGGGSLQLSGELGRLRSDEIAQAHLPQDARVVLSACHAASAESGLARAFALAGALEIASAAGSVDDAAAARWAAAFYPALARGLSFVQANRAALLEQPADLPRAWFVVTK